MRILGSEARFDANLDAILTMPGNKRKTPVTTACEGRSTEAGLGNLPMDPGYSKL